MEYALRGWTWFANCYELYPKKKRAALRTALFARDRFVFLSDSADFAAAAQCGSTSEAGTKDRKRQRFRSGGDVYRIKVYEAWIVTENKRQVSRYTSCGLKEGKRL